MRNSHCSYCGAKFPEQSKYPRKCFQCYQDTFSNPFPTVVAAIRVWDPEKQGKDRRWGVLLQKRNINPKKDKWGLMGGYMEGSTLETWQEATSRETMEEVGLSIPPQSFNLVDAVSQPIQVGYVLLLRSIAIPIIYWEQIKFKPNDEVSEIVIAYEPQELAFDTHTELLKMTLGMI